MPETSFFSLKVLLLRWCGAEIGDNVRICSSARFLGAGTLQIDSGTWVGQQVLIVASGNIRIGKNVDIAPMVYMGNGTHKIDFEGDRCAGPGINRDITIGDGCWLCVRSTILPGATVGPHSIVGACALVKGSFPEKRILLGIPAKSVSVSKYEH